MRHARFLPVTGVLTTHEITWLQRSHRFEDLRLLGVDRAKIPDDRRFHGQERDNLEQVVLNHVAQAPRGLVEGAPPVHAELLGKGDLDTGDVVAIPDRFQERIGKAEVEDVHDRLLPQEMIDPEDRVLGEHRPRDGVEFARGGQIAAERLFDDDPRVVRQTGSADPLNHRLE